MKSFSLVAFPLLVAVSLPTPSVAALSPAGLAEAAAATAPPPAAPGAAGEPPVTRVQRIELGSVAAPESGAAAREAAGSRRSLGIVRERVAEFSAVAVSWAYQRQVRDVEVAARVQREGEWTPWRLASAFETAEEVAATRERARTGAELLWFGPSDGVEVAVAAADGAAPERVRLELIDPGDAPADHEALLAQGDAPEIRGRADWGADEDKMTWDPEYADRLSAITLHHTATTNEYQPDDVPKIIRSIYQYQAETLEWGDIGYNVLLDRFGRLWEGRAGGLDKPVIGAHAGGFNTRTAGIGVIGLHTDTPMPDEVIESAAHYAAWRFAPYEVDPRGSTRLTGGPSSKYDHRVTITVPRVFPHRRTSATECPGDEGVAALAPIRERAYGRMP